MTVRLVRQRPFDRRGQLSVRRAAPEQRFQVKPLLRRQTRLEETVRRQAQAVALRAEPMAERADEADLAAKAGKIKILRRTVAAFFRRRAGRTEGALKKLDQL